MVGKDAVLTLGGAPASVKARQDDTAQATTDTGLAIGFLLAIAALEANAHDRGGSNASFDGELMSASQLTVQSDTTRSAIAKLFVVSISLAFGATFADSHTSVGDDAASIDQASLGPDTNIHSAGTAITVKSTRGASALSEANGGAGGILAGGAVMKAISSVTGAVKAFADDGATIGTNSGKPGNLQILATDYSTSASNATVGAGALGFAAGGSITDATTSPTVEAYIGSSVHVVLATGLGHDVTVKALSNDAEADATSKSFGGGAIHIGGPEANATSKPVVHAYIGGSTTIVAGGGVFVDGESQAIGNGTPLTDYITGLTPDGGASPDNTITFTQHGLTTGDLVLYDANGGAVIGGLRNTHVYGVIVANDHQLRLGATFAGASIDADSLDGSVTGIDPNRAMVRFAAAHHLETGDAVIYRISTGGSSISSDFIDGSVLYVRVIDANTIELYTTFAAATSAVFDFNTGAVSGNQIANSTLADGARVTYKSPNPLLFRGGSCASPLTSCSSGVGVTESGGTISGNNMSDAGNSVIFLGHVDTLNGPTLGHGFTEGQRVVYQVSDPSEHVIGLTNGGIYYVHVVDAWTIQLANSYCEAVGHAFDNACVDGSNNPINQNLISIGRAADNTVQHAIRPAPLTNLSDGITYQVHRVNGGHITLRPEGGGSDISLATDHVFGDAYDANEHLFLAGSVLHAAIGSQQVYLQLTGSLPSTTERLLASDGSSLRAAAPPSGDGQSSSSARGGGGGLGDFSFPGATTEVGPTVKAYIAASTITVDGDVTVTSIVGTHSSSSTENGSGGVIAVSDVTSNVKGTDNNSAFIGADFGGDGISGDTGPATSQVDATGITIKAGRQHQGRLQRRS